MGTEPAAKGYLPPEDGHEVAWYVYGNPEGLPVLFLHGGPGSGFNTDYLPFFPLERVCLVTFDQRGCGQSRPHGGTAGNNTQALLRDIERLRGLLKVEKWTVTGHSWGATLAVLYAKAFPQHCRSLALASFFGALPEDQIWTFEGIRQFYPAEQAALEALRPKGDSRRLDFWVYEALGAGEAEELAFRLSSLSSASCRMNPNPVRREDITPERIRKWQMLFYYAVNDFFLSPPESLYDGLEKIRKIPFCLVHGQFDMDCPPAQAFRLKKCLPHMDLRLVAGNHSLAEPEMETAFREIIAESLSK